MAPHITGAPGLAERFPELAAKLRPTFLMGTVAVVPNVLPSWSVRGVLREAEAAGLSPSGIMLPDETGVAKHTLVPGFKKRDDYVVTGPLSGHLIAVVSDALTKLGMMEPGFVFEHHRVGFYGPGGHFEAHRDDMLPQTASRRVVASLLLNDPSEYEGGALELPEAGLSIRPPAGALVAFPASALHRVTPVTSGVRKVLLTFILKGTT